MNTAEISRFSHKIHQRQDTITRQWYAAFVSAGCILLERDEAIHTLAQLTDRAIAFLLAENKDEAEAREIGAALASLHFIEPEILEATESLWSRHLFECTSQGEMEWLFSRLSTLFKGMTTGFIRKARQVILNEQEQIRLAMATDLLRTTEELKKFQSQLEAMLAERTQALRDSEEQFRIIAETSQEGIFQSSTPEGALLFMNDAFPRMLGYTKEELTGRTTLSLIAEEDLPRLNPFAEKLHANQPVSGDFRMKHKDGHLIDVHFSVVPTLLKGRIIRSGIVQDISERIRTEKALRASEQRYRVLAEAAQDIIFIVNRQDKFEYVNPAAAMHLGFKQDDLVGQPREKFFTGMFLSRTKSNLAKVFASGETRYVEAKLEVLQYKKWLSTWLVPLRDERGEVNSVLGISRDISS